MLSGMGGWAAAAKPKTNRLRNNAFKQSGHPLRMAFRPARLLAGIILTSMRSGRVSRRPFRNQAQDAASANRDLATQVPSAKRPLKTLPRSLIRKTLP